MRGVGILHSECRLDKLLNMLKMNGTEQPVFTNKTATILPTISIIIIIIAMIIIIVIVIISFLGIIVIIITVIVVVIHLRIQSSIHCNLL